MAREELKISIIIKGDKIFMGVQATDCDPKMLTMKGDLPAALTRVPSFVAESNAAWDISARNPKTVEPVVVSTPAPARVATTGRAFGKQDGGRGSASKAQDSAKFLLAVTCAI